MRGPFLIQVRDHTHPSNGMYVAPPGTTRSYVRDPLTARRFETLAAAEDECCTNEVVRSLPALINL